MSLGERIQFFRNLRGFTQQWLGEASGFPYNCAASRISQYETGVRVPKIKTVQIIAEALQISPHALTVPDIDADIRLMHTLFVLEDTKALCVERDVNSGEIILCFRGPHNQLQDMLSQWQQEAARLKNGEITKKEYDQWRYNYTSSLP